VNGAIPVKNGLVIAAAIVIGAAVGCSSGEAKPKPGTLPPGTAQLTIDGKNAGNTGVVHCAAVESLMTIKTGDDAAGSTAMVSQKGKLAVEFVRIRNLNGFSGDYNLNLDGSAAVALTENTYDITGTAKGFGPTSIAPTTKPFTIKVAC
jgi:ipoprotein LpqH